MTKNWMIRGLCLALVAMSLTGCIVVPERGHHHPVFFVP
jgi:hypothetical protein